MSSDVFPIIHTSFRCKICHRPSHGSGSHVASSANIQGSISWPFTWPEDQLRKTKNQFSLSPTWWIYRWCICLCDWMHRNCTTWHDVITSMWCHHTRWILACHMTDMLLVIWEARDKRKPRTKGHKEQTTMTMKSTLLKSKRLQSKEGHRQRLLDVSVHTGGIIAL